MQRRFDCRESCGGFTDRYNDESKHKEHGLRKTSQWQKKRLFVALLGDRRIDTDRKKPHRSCTWASTSTARDARHMRHRVSRHSPSLTGGLSWRSSLWLWPLLRSCSCRCLSVLNTDYFESSTPACAVRTWIKIHTYLGHQVRQRLLQLVDASSHFIECQVQDNTSKKRTKIKGQDWIFLETIWSLMPWNLSCCMDEIHSTPITNHLLQEILDVCGKILDSLFSSTSLWL